MKFVRLPLAAAAALCAMSLSAFAGPGHDHPAVQRALGHLKGGPASLAADVADAGDDFQPRDLVTDRNGHEHVRFDRTFRGLPVIGGDVVVHSDDKGRLKHFSRTLNGKFNLDTSASLSEDAALSYARSLFAGPDFYSGFWLVEAPSDAAALDLARRGSKACNRRVELRPLLG